MNGRERFASAVLLITLITGILADALDDEGVDEPVLCEASAENADRSRPEHDYRRLDINLATVEELMILPGIGPKKAKAVLAWREQNGGFDSVEHLVRVKGIGPKTLERIRRYICVGTGIPATGN